MEKKAILSSSNGSIELPIYSGTLGQDVIDIRAFNQLNLFSFDVGLCATASCRSRITFIDGDQGILLYRGYPIDALAHHAHYLEVCYLLLKGELPQSQEYEIFERSIKNHHSIHDQMTSFFKGFRRDAHPMALMMGVVAALSAFYSINVEESEDRLLAAIQLIAKMPALAAMCHRYTVGEPFLHPREDLSYAANFLYMMFNKPNSMKDPDPVLVRALNRIFILHADHEQNASTSVVRSAGSTGANPFACIAAGIATLWGPAHGGANEACLNMLHTIGDVSQIPRYIQKAKDKNDPFRLMGFGHRVYKSYDPRASVMRQTAHEVLDALGRKEEPLFQLAMALEQVALEDPYFIERKLYPNVDFYSGITLSALGIPINMFTVVFALARTSGWMAHWIEMMEDPEHRLVRPRQLYLGETQRAWMSMSDRTPELCATVPQK